MTGPYTAHLFLNPNLFDRRVAENADLSLNWDDDREALNEGSGIAMRYWQRGGGATVDGTLQSATLYAASLLSPGEGVAVDVYGREVQQSGDKQVLCRSAYAYRDAEGRLFTDLGSRNGSDRHFIGL